MAHRGQRSQFSLQRRAAKHIIHDTAFIDRINGEIVDLIERGEVEDQLALLFAEPDRRAIPEVFPGLVLVDGYGQGAFQPKNEPSCEWSNISPISTPP
jgi:hypothetical protein